MERYATLKLEQLEDRLVPTPIVFTWTGAAGDHIWSHEANWSNSAGLIDINAYPGVRGDDVAHFSGASSNSSANCYGETIGALQVDGNYSGTITLMGGTALILTGVADYPSWINSSAATFAQGTGSTLEVQGGYLNWTAGTINDTTTSAVLEAYGGSIYIEGSGPKTGDAVVANGGGQLAFYNGGCLTLDYNALVHVYSGSYAFMYGTSSIAETTTGHTVYNQGLFTVEKTGSIQADAYIDAGFYNTGTNASLSIGDTSYLTVQDKSSQTGSYSLYNNNGAKVWLTGTAEIDTEFGICNNAFIYCEKAPGGTSFVATLQSVGGSFYQSQAGAVLQLGGSVLANNEGTGTLTFTGFANITLGFGSVYFGYDSASDTMSSIYANCGVTFNPGLAFSFSDVPGGTNPTPGPGVSYTLWYLTGGIITDNADPSPVGWTGHKNSNSTQYYID